MKPNSVLRAFFAIAVPAAAWAQATLPTGANVVAGSATISATANSMTVATGSQRTIIDYSGFNVGTGNSVRFDQPSSASATLNRVISTEGSSILGSVSSNGQIFLVNPNGIFVGAGGSFSGSSIYLSTGNISNADFLGGNIRFDPPPAGGTIRVQGNIVATDDLFVKASTVTIESPGRMDSGGSQNINVTNLTVNGAGSGGGISLSPFTLGGTISLSPLTLGGTSSGGGNLSFTGGQFASYAGTTVYTGSGGALVLTGGTSITPSTNITAIPTITVGPISPVIISGSATFPSTSPVLTVTNSNGAIINWQRFSIAANQSIHFAQPSASSSVLNRVLGNPVPIYGTVTTNGKVWLVGPAGIIVDPTRVVSTDGLKLSSVSIQTPNLVATAKPPRARPVVPSIPRGTSNLVDGTVTVRLSLVDAAPISLR